MEHAFPEIKSSFYNCKRQNEVVRGFMNEFKLQPLDTFFSVLQTLKCGVCNV